MGRKFSNVKRQYVSVEVENVKEKNFLFCCLYRHPNSSPDNLSTYLQEVLSNPVVSNKQIFLLRDFNLDPLNYDSHTATGEFVKLLLSKKFCHILYIQLECLIILLQL